MRRLQIKHLTTYQYVEAVTLFPHQLLLRPREGHDVHIESIDIAIFPAHVMQWQRDVNDNTLLVVAFTQPSNWLSIESRFTLQHYDDQPLNFLVADYAVYYPFRYYPAEQAELCAYLLPIFPADLPVLAEWLQPFLQTGRMMETYVLLDSINQRIARDFTYWQREEPGVQSPAETLRKRTGSCRDFAALFTEACRYLGLAVRFVSGYLCSSTFIQGQGATHAWAEVYLPGAGWKGFDPTSGRVVGNDHIAVAVSRNPEAVPPVSGSFLGASNQSPIMQVIVEVAELMV